MKIDKLYESGDNLIYRDDKGKIRRCKKPKFAHGQIVKANSSHHSPKNITRVIDPSLGSDRKWYYGENYIDEQGSCGGTGYSFSEDKFSEISDPKFLMIAKRIELNRDLLNAKSLVKNIESDLSKLEFAMDLAIKEDWRTANRSCKICGKLFSGFIGGDANKNLCDEHLNNKS